MEGEKEFYVIVQGEKVAVSEEVYRAYVRPVRRDQRRKRRNQRCRIVGEKGNLIRCPNNCSKCPYATDGKPNGSVLSLDEFRERGREIENRAMDIEENYIAEEERQERAEKLHAAIAQLSPRQKRMVELIYFEGMTQNELAELYGVDKSAISHAMKRIYSAIKKFYEKQ